MIKLRPYQTELIDGQIVIKKMAIIDGDTGDTVRIATITPELKQLIESIEIDISDYANFVAMKSKNGALKKLVTDFNLILTGQGGPTK